MGGSVLNTPRLIKAAVRDRLKAWPAFDGFPIFTDFEQNLPGKVDAAMEADNAGGGKVGAYALVTIPNTSDNLPNVILGPNQHALVVVFTENLFVNLSDRGWGITGDDFLTDAKDLLKSTQLDGIAWLHSPQRVYSPGSDNPMQGYRISRLVLLADDRTVGGVTTKVVKPEITFSGGFATITCATDGATIFYSIDSTIYPSAKAGAVQYVGPITSMDGMTVTACAYLVGSIPSDVARKTQ